MRWERALISDGSWSPEERWSDPYRGVGTFFKKIAALLRYNSAI